jgi:hypothetical protein
MKWGRVVIVWQEVALPMRNIVRKTNTRSLKQSHAGYLKNVVAAWGAVLLGFHGDFNLYR